MCEGGNKDKTIGRLSKKKTWTKGSGRVCNKRKEDVSWVWGRKRKLLFQNKKKRRGKDFSGEYHEEETEGKFETLH